MSGLTCSSALTQRGKSTLLRSLAGAKYDLSGEERPKFVFDLFVGKTRTPLTAPHADLLQGPFETSLKRWESLGEVAERASGRLPIVHIAATRLSVPLSTDTPSIQQMLSERSDWRAWLTSLKTRSRLVYLTAARCITLPRRLAKTCRRKVRRPINPSDDQSVSTSLRLCKSDLLRRTA